MGCGTPYNGPAGSFSTGYPHFGPYTGAPVDADRLPPYSLTESLEGTSGPDSTAYATPATDEPAKLPAQVSRIGFSQATAVEAGGARGLKLADVAPGTPAEKSGLQPGDVIQSINGYNTTQPENLAWIIANAAPDSILKMVVRTAADDTTRSITVQLR